MTRKYFGTDGIRGTVGQDPITPDFVLRLAHAVGHVLRKTEPRPTVLIGKDTRISGYMLESALQVLQACVRSGKTLAELLADMVLFPQVLVNVRLKAGQDWQGNEALAVQTRAVESELAGTGRLLIRASGTEPLLRVMVEARNAEHAESCAQRIADTVRF